MRIHREHSMGLDEARSKIDSVADKLKQQFGLNSEWQDDKLMVSGNGVKGEVAVDDHCIDMNIRLGFALQLMEGPIRSAIESTLDKHIAE